LADAAAIGRPRLGPVCRGGRVGFLESLVGDVMSLSTGTPARNQGPGSSLPGPAAGHPLQRAGRLAAGQPEL